MPDFDFISYDNSAPRPQLWTWRGRQDESAEPQYRIPAGDTIEIANRALAESRRLRAALEAIAGDWMRGKGPIEIRSFARDILSQGTPNART